MLSMESMLRTLAIVMVNLIAGLIADYSISLTMYIIGGSILVLTLVSKVSEDQLID